MGFITIKIDDKYDELIEGLTEKQKEKLHKILSADANLILTAVAHTDPEDLDKLFKIYDRLYKMVFQLIMLDEDENDSNNEENGKEN